MDKIDFRNLRNKVKSEGLLSTSPKVSLLIITFETLMFIILFYFLINTEVFSFSYWSLIIISGIGMFRFFTLLHDCGHRTLFKTKSRNTWAGLFCSMFCFIPYFPWRDLHIQHHKWVGVIDKDPTQVGLIKLRQASIVKRNLFRLVWWLCIPIPSIQLIFTVFWAYPFKALIKHDHSEAKKGLFSILICLLPHAILLATFGGKAYFIYVLPIIICFFIWFETINFTHHSGLFPFTSKTRNKPIPLHEQDSVTRSSTFFTFGSTLLCYNFNFHTEHHYFPTVPWHNLPKVTQLMQEFPKNKDYNDVSFLAFSAYLRTKDPVDLYIKSQFKTINLKEK
ncbi:MAG: fatty acid desaturase [Colwellia sp.]|nr:fatty acid desaturase [Colwellia sp.]